MPELPEVETIVRKVRPLLVGREIAAFSSRWAKQATPGVPAIRAKIVGRRIVTVQRRAKYVVWQLDASGWLLVHLRMSGRLEWSADHARTPPYVRTTWTFADSHKLWFCDARKFGRVVYTEDLAAATRHLGVEPLDRRFTAAWLTRELERRGRQLKPLLLDQSFIAGLGNIYTDEALHRVGLHPLCRSDAVTPEDSVRLHRAIRDVLREAIRNHGTTIDWIYPGGWMQERLRVYGRTGEPCRRCGTPIAYLRVGQRGTHICPQCQPLRRTRRRSARPA